MHLKEAPKQPLNYLEFCGRLFVVVNGQPFYKSTGSNTGLPNTWFPIVMCRPKMQLDESSLAFLTIPEPYDINHWQDIFRQLDPGHIIKYSKGVVKDRVIDINVAKIDKILSESHSGKNDNQRIDSSGRILKREHLILSAKLGGGTWDNQVIKNKIMKEINLSSKEKLFLNNKIIIDDKPEFQTGDPDLANLWLIKNGAKDILEIFRLNEEKNDMFSTIEFQKSLLVKPKTFLKLNQPHST
jgi:hypothetical protein